MLSKQIIENQVRYIFIILSVFIFSITIISCGGSDDKVTVSTTNGLFVTVGNVGSILTSSDGISWTERTSGTTKNLYGVTYGGGLLVAVGDNGTILTSSSGTSWTSRTSGITKNLYGVTYGGGLFVTVGDNGTILTSSDGTTWANTSANKRTTLRYFSKPDAPHLYGVTYGEGLFVTVGGNATILTSSDGTTWTENGQNLRSNWGDAQYFKAVTYRKKLFVLGGRNGKIMNSPDGITWKQRKSGTSMDRMGVTYAPTCGKVEWKGLDAGLCKNGIFVSVGKGGKIITSFDGNWWVKRTFKGAGWIYAVTYGNGTFVSVGENGVILSSFDGISWLRRVTGNEIKSKGIDNIKEDVPTGYLDIRSDGHNLDVGDVIRFTTTGTLPLGLALSTNYYVVATPANNSFFVSRTEGGTPIDFCDTELNDNSTDSPCKGHGKPGAPIGEWHAWHYSIETDIDEREEEDTERRARTSFAVPSVTVEDLNAVTYSDQL